MEIQSEFMGTNVLKHDLNKVWFDLKETNTDSESVALILKDFKRKT